MASQERQRAWDSYETEYKQWNAGPPPGKPMHGDAKPLKDYTSPEPLPDFALVSCRAASQWALSSGAKCATGQPWLLTDIARAPCTSYDVEPSCRS